MRRAAITVFLALLFVACLAIAWQLWGWFIRLHVGGCSS